MIRIRYACRRCSWTRLATPVADLEDWEAEIDTCPWCGGAVEARVIGQGAVR